MFAARLSDRHVDGSFWPRRANENASSSGCWTKDTKFAMLTCEAAAGLQLLSCCPTPFFGTSAPWFA